jgi:FemAB-related protein (PEP-CTERM system-associated)
MSASAQPTVSSFNVRRLHGQELDRRLPALEAYFAGRSLAPLGQHPGWLRVLQGGLGQTAYALEAVSAGVTRGFLPLAFVRSLLFGRFLVSLPYLNSNGVLADDDQSARGLVDQAVRLADELSVRHLELRHERPIEHPALRGKLENKVHMRLALTDFVGPLWQGLNAKVRNQVRKGEKSGLSVQWGSVDLLEAFYTVFSHNMRDLGTPVYGRPLFQHALRAFPQDAELCIVRADDQPVAAALVLHGRGITEIPSASCLRAFNHTCANMLMYWHLIDRAVQRGQKVFDFGRCTRDSNTFRFKRQWGAQPEPATWQYYQREGRPSDMRPENPRYQRLIRIWQRLPVPLTRMLGPAIVRGIP